LYLPLLLQLPLLLLLLLQLRVIPPPLHSAACSFRRRVFVHRQTCLPEGRSHFFAAREFSDAQKQCADGAQIRRRNFPHLPDDISPFVRYIPCMAFFIPERGRKQFVVQCKGCMRDVPAGVTEQPKVYIAVSCPLCRERRYYLPTEVGLGFLHHEYRKITRTGGGKRV
jgi:hypothetical protein